MLAIVLQLFQNITTTKKRKSVKSLLGAVAVELFLLKLWKSVKDNVTANKFIL